MSDEKIPPINEKSVGSEVPERSLQEQTLQTTFSDRWYADPDVFSEKVASNPSETGRPGCMARHYIWPLAKAVGWGSQLDIERELTNLLEHSDIECHAPGWTSALKKFRSIVNRFSEKLTLADDDGAIRVKEWNNHPLFMKGNSKLPFWIWKILPVVTCPGRGKAEKNGCEKWCYSLKAWRNGLPFVTNAANTLVARFRPEVIWEALPLLGNSSLRVHVDGDFFMYDYLDDWMNALRRNPAINAYCYSKSWWMLNQWDRRNSGAWPKNFVINMSSGSVFEDKPAVRKITESLSCVRGDFAAVKATGLPKWKKKMTHAEYVATLDKYISRVAVAAEAKFGAGNFWVCPGDCGNCMNAETGMQNMVENAKTEHACGSRKMDGVRIVIGMH
jgi:hypothetical protein